MKRFLTLLLTILGFSGIMSSCVSEYGSPHSEWEIKGTVTDPQGNPIKGIKVSTSVYTNGEELFTDDEGNYNIPNHYDKRPKYVAFDDIDEVENGGEFNSTERPVAFVNSDFVGGDGKWYQGKATKIINVTMTLKTDQEVEN